MAQLLSNDDDGARSDYPPPPSDGEAPASLVQPEENREMHAISTKMLRKLDSYDPPVNSTLSILARILDASFLNRCADDAIMRSYDSIPADAQDSLQHTSEPGGSKHNATCSPRIGSASSYCSNCSLNQSWQASKKMRVPPF